MKNVVKFDLQMYGIDNSQQNGEEGAEVYLPSHHLLVFNPLFHEPLHPLYALAMSATTYQFTECY